jgi:hypothetical protein
MPKVDQRRDVTHRPMGQPTAWHILRHGLTLAVTVLLGVMFFANAAGLPALVVPSIFAPSRPND